MDIQFKDTVWISMSKAFHSKPSVIGVIYNPPEGSPYADPMYLNYYQRALVENYLSLFIQ